MSVVTHDEVITYRKFFEYNKEENAPLRKLVLSEPIKGDNYIYYND